MPELDNSRGPSCVVTQVDPAVLAAAPVPEIPPAPESERPAVPPDDLAAAQMRMLVVSEILAEEAEAAQQPQSSSGDPNVAADGDEADSAPPPVFGAPAVTREQTEASGVEEPPLLED